MEQFTTWFSEYLPQIISYALIIGEFIGIMLLKLALNVIKEKLTGWKTKATKDIEDAGVKLFEQKTEFETKLKYQADNFNTEITELKNVFGEVKTILVNDAEMVSNGKAREIAKLMEKVEKRKGDNK